LLLQTPGGGCGSVNKTSSLVNSVKLVTRFLYVNRHEEGSRTSRLANSVTESCNKVSVGEPVKGSRTNSLENSIKVVARFP